MNNIILFCSTDDWKGLYINGELINQGHSVYVGCVFDCLRHKGMSIDFSKVVIKDIEFSEEEMEQMGFEFPESANDLIKSE